MEQNIKEVKTIAKVIHDYIYNNIKLSDQEHATFIAGCLIALCDKNFRGKYQQDYSNNPEKFTQEVINAIKNSIDNCEGLNDKKDIIKAEYDFIARNEQLKKLVLVDGEQQTNLQYIISLLNIVYDVAISCPEYDVLGCFYDQFSKYSASDQQSLGIVLTPFHVADFMSELLEINENDIVLDTCCGSASLLLSAGSKAKMCIGVELNSRMAAIANANQIIKGRPSHLWLGNSFDLNIQEQIKAYKPTKLIINPPYAQQEKELSFLETGLNLLQPGGIGVIIMPVSCANKLDFESKTIRKNILSKHKLLASFIMPEQLFAPAVGVNTIICVFKAYAANNGNSFLAYIKDDGFELTKSEGRIDKNNKWPEIRKDFLTLYHSMQAENKKAVLVDINDSDEWSAISYLDVSENYYEDQFFIPHIQNYLMYIIQGGSKNV